MPLTPYLHGRAFDPETLKCMGAAFEAACAKVGIKNKDDPFTQMAAEKVIVLVQPGDKDPAALCDRVLQSLSKMP